MNRNRSRINYEALHYFIEGLKGDFAENEESKKSYQDAKNGRLYSHNGVTSFSSIKGTKEVYKNDKIVKHLGYWAFEDELIIFVKCLPNITGNENTNVNVDYETIEKLIASSFSVSADFEVNSLEIDIEPKVELSSFSIPVITENKDPLSFNIPFSCINSSGNEIDFTEYYEEILNKDNLETCQITLTGEFENNKEFIDCIYSLKKDSAGIIYDELLWSGLFNWPLDGKICTYGIYENNFYKRVYFTDYVNPFRVINIKDSNLSSRNSRELSSFQSNALLQPKVISINSNGELKAGTVLYTYRLITENGQETEFSPLSESVKILSDDEGYDYAGGDISEITNKSVSIKCNIIGWENFYKIECVAVEYEAFGSPTSIKSLGVFDTGPVVTFEHFGNEAEFSSDLTLSELLVRKNTWKYCSDISSKGNKLFTIGLRNDPLPAEVLRLNQSFALHSWTKEGETHECLINPEPSKYRYIDPKKKDKMFYINQRVYNSIQAFSSFRITLLNTLNGETYSKDFKSLSRESYEDYTQEIFNWLETLQSNIEFLTKFPNIKIEFTSGKIHFSPILDTLQTDFSNIKFTYSIRQIIEDFEDDVKFINLSVSDELIYGAVSLGFNQGNGIRITYQTEIIEVLEKAKSSDSKPILNIKTPDSKKGFFKGEIYRLGIQLYDIDGYQLFTIPIGDIKIPEIGEEKRYLDHQGNVIIKSITDTPNYVNSKVIGNKLYAEKTTLKVEVRLSCEIQSLISMYQLVYVERNESNRTILCQGISAPMQRTNLFTNNLRFEDAVANKWNLPFYGGPSYDLNGLSLYDADPNYGDDKGTDIGENRIVTNRSLFYFDSPDIIFNKISSEKIRNGSVQRIARLNTDHRKRNIALDLPEEYPNFSTKIQRDEIDGEEIRKPSFINVSVFLEKRGLNDLIEIKEAEILERGHIIPGTKLGVNHEVSNNAMALQEQYWFHLTRSRQALRCNNLFGPDGLKSELFESNTVSIGFKTVIIKTNNDVFTENFIDQNPFETSLSRDSTKSYDTHAIINIKLNNESNVYGGRTELAYSKNVFIPLGETIPVLKTTNNTQKFTVYGDSYTSLYVRNKNTFNDDPVTTNFMMSDSSNCNQNVIGTKHNGAWCYAVVLESSIETKWTDKETFYKTDGLFDFKREWSELINEAYFQENTLKTYIPKPFNFKDDPNLNNIIAVSDVKLFGDYLDNWTSFRVNNFYELEKDKGTAYNLAKYLDDLYALQEEQTSLLQIDENVMIPSTKGEISMQQGDGKGISNHKIVSDYGTSIRRAAIEIVSNSKKIGGFVFFDEHRFEWIKIDQPYLIERDLHLRIRELFEDDKITDIEGYFDDEYKESNIRIRTKSNKNYTLSFNEKLVVFNSFIDYDNDIYMVWNENIFAPKTIDVTDLQTQNKRSDSSSLHQLNKGLFLDFFGDKKTMKIKVTININPELIKIFKHWAGIINIDYPIKNMIINTSSGQTRVLNGLHYRYQIKEGRHSLPLKNRNDWEDLRGQWATIEIEVESKNNKKVDFFSFINFVRHSYQ